MNNHSVKKPVRLTLFVFLILAVLSFLPTKFEVFEFTSKPVDIFSSFTEENDDFYYEDEEFFEIDTTESEEYFEDEYFEDEDLESSIYNNPELNIASAGIFDAVSEFYRSENEKITNYLSNNNPRFRNVKLSGNTDQLKHFFDALKKADKQIVRVAHYGDSAIEGDNITAELRDRLQKEFGGSGLGFLAITSQDVKFRPTVTHTFSDTWENAAVFTINPRRLEVGVNGEVFIPKLRSWVDYRTTSRYRRLKDFRTVKLFYSDAIRSTISYEFDRKNKEEIKLEPGKGLHVAEMTPTRKAREIKIEVTQKDQAHFYGVSLENGNGVIVDNFPLRGNSGIALNDISSGSLNDFSKFIDYKLIILQFGLNITTNSKNADYTWYEREMVKAIRKFKRAFPDCSFIVVGVGDKSIKRGSRFVTNPSIPELIKAQKDIARKADVAFWNLFEAMGGQDSMEDWVNASPPLASKDYTHFTLHGSKKVAELLSNSILYSYKQHK